MNSASAGTLAKHLPDASDFELQVLRKPDPSRAIAGETASMGSDYSLRIAVVYHGAAAWDWACQVVAYTCEQVGNGCVESAGWEIGQLNGFLAHAAAAQA